MVTVHEDGQDLFQAVGMLMHKILHLYHLRLLIVYEDLDVLETCKINLLVLVRQFV